MKKLISLLLISCFLATSCADQPGYLKKKSPYQKENRHKPPNPRY